MNDSAANKLLKILEEPPEKTIFILVCHQYDQLLTTIISRTQLVKFSVNNESEIIELLQVKGFNQQKSGQWFFNNSHRFFGCWLEYCMCNFAQITYI